MRWRERGTCRQPSSAKRSRFKPHRLVSPHAKASEQLGPLGAALGPRTCPQLSEDAAPGCSPTPPSHASVRPPHPGSDLLLSPDTREGDGHLALGPSPHFLRSLSPPRRPPQGCERTQCAGGAGSAAGQLRKGGAAQVLVSSSTQLKCHHIPARHSKDKVSTGLQEARV